MLTLKQVRLLLPAEAWTVSLDLKDGFYHLMVSKKFRPYLGFCYKGQKWRFRAMPFGLNTAPLIFTKIMSFSILCLTKEGIWALPYLDDILIIAKTRLECLQKVQKAVQILEKLGWIINTEKSRLIPQQVFNWLGVHYNLLNHTVQNTVETHSQFLTQLRELLTQRTTTKRHIMRLQGLANWLGQVNPLARLFLSRTKPLLSHLKRVKLDTELQVNNRMKSLMAKWLTLTRNPQRLGLPKTTCTVLTDASKTGWGFTINQQRFQTSKESSTNPWTITVSMSWNS